MSDLSKMLAAQERLQRWSYGRDVETMTDDERMAYVRDNVLALTDELHEALAETGWKPWATSKHLNTEAYLDELVDAFHFFMNLLLATGLTPEMLASYVVKKYAEKSARNAARQADGYDGISGKCPGCGRALDDEAVYCRKSNVALEHIWCVQKAAYFDVVTGAQLPVETIIKPSVRP